jgi:hypothetical protein
MVKIECLFVLLPPHLNLYMYVNAIGLCPFIFTTFTVLTAKRCPQTPSQSALSILSGFTLQAPDTHTDAQNAFHMGRISLSEWATFPLFYPFAGHGKI